MLVNLTPGFLNSFEVQILAFRIYELDPWGQSYKTNFGLRYIKNGLIEEKIGKSKL